MSYHLHSIRLPHAREQGLVRRLAEFFFGNPPHRSRSLSHRRFVLRPYHFLFLLDFIASVDKNIFNYVTQVSVAMYAVDVFLSLCLLLFVLSCSRLA
ncbi:hypothetical protein I7I53_11727 [Histoplasma capsulatum var. duboisii H88]|uniref:Uncharacterized protein n=1 Tax=Ajellomyces capsulatus (strain H88) TaxID=544711 RepID=A0A8A1LTU5_AJEC8|nr:hypothetical protein I7I53_11727 [Histoplasma capsulatum var. duboisii H88]